MNAFIKFRIGELGTNVESIASQMGVRPSSLRTWISRRRLPQAHWQKLATMLNISASELEKHGFKVARSRISHSKDLEDVLPLVKTIVASGCKSVSLKQLRILISLQAQIGKPIS